MDQSNQDDYELDLDGNSPRFGGRNGRIILLGDGSEALADPDDADMFDHSEEDKDTPNQVSKGPPLYHATADEDESRRGDRAETPAPNTTESPSSIRTEEDRSSPPLHDHPRAQPPPNESDNAT